MHKKINKLFIGMTLAALLISGCSSQPVPEEKSQKPAATTETTPEPTPSKETAATPEPVLSHETPATPEPVPSMEPENIPQISATTESGEPLPANACDPPLPVNPAVQQAEEIYTLIESSLASYTVIGEGTPVTLYTDSDHTVRKISIEKGTYDQIPLSADYTIEFFYENISSVYELRFMHLINEDGEYKLYYNSNGVCVRIVLPDQTIYDGPDAASYLQENPDFDQLYLQSKSELHLAFAS